MYQVDFEPITNRQTWTDTIELADDDTGELIDLSSAQIVFAVTNPRTKTIVLTATTESGKITVPALGTFQFEFASGEVRQLCAGEVYEVGCAMTLNGKDVPILTGTVTVLDGGVP